MRQAEAPASGRGAQTQAEDVGVREGRETYPRGEPEITKEASAGDGAAGGAVPPPLRVREQPGDGGGASGKRDDVDRRRSERRQLAK